MKIRRFFLCPSQEESTPAICANNQNLASFENDPGYQTMMSIDTNQDCRVNLSDLALMAQDWLKCNHIYEEMCQ